MTRHCTYRTCANLAVRGAIHHLCEAHARICNVQNPHINATETARRIQNLHQNLGWTVTALMAETGLGQDTIEALLKNRYSLVRKRTADLIADINPAHPTSNGRNVPAWPYQRRLHALQAAGWSQGQLATHTGIQQTTLSKISCGRRTVNRDIAHAILTFWHTVEHQPVKGPPTPTAEKHNWAQPAFWDNIDDPDTHPGVTHCIECDQPVRTRGRCKKHHKRLYDQERTRRHAAA